MSDDDRLLKILAEQNKRLNKIEDLLQKLTKNSGTTTVEKKSKKPQHQKTSISAMLLYFKEDNFFDGPKTLSDIVTRFKQESRNVKSTGLTLPLQRLVRSRTLGRVLKDGKWHYVSR